MIWQRAKGGGNSKKVVRGHEYILCYFREQELTLTQKGDKTLEHIKKWKLEKQKERYVIKNGKLFFINDDIVRRVFGKYERGTERRCEYENILEFKGQKAKEEIDEKLKTGEYILKKATNKFNYICRLEEVATMRQILYSIIQGYLSEVGKNDLAELGMESMFEYPKPVGLIKIILDTILNKDSVILDFFAGSGTTGHAVMELNKEDGGNRKFILCTNNENNICEQVTYPRLQKVIKGYMKNGNGEKVEGLGGNLQYFKTDLVKQTKNKDQLRADLTEKCTEMLCVKENIFNLSTEHEDYKIFSSNKGDSFLCVYYNLFDESFASFLKELKKLNGQKKIYMFSIDGLIDRKLFKGIKDCDVEEIPQKIIDVYKQLVKMNIPLKADTIFLEFEKANKKIFEAKEKDEGARILRIVLEKTIQKIAQKNIVSIFKDNHKEEKISVLNDKLKDARVLNQVKWEENKTYLAIGNNAAHGDYDQYTLTQVENFYRYIQSLFNDFGI